MSNKTIFDNNFINKLLCSIQELSRYGYEDSRACYDNFIKYKTNIIEVITYQIIASERSYIERTARGLTAHEVRFYSPEFEYIWF